MCFKLSSVCESMCCVSEGFHSKVWWKNPLLLGTHVSKAAPKRSTWGNFCRLIFLGWIFWDCMYLWMVIVYIIYIYTSVLYLIPVCDALGCNPMNDQGYFHGNSLEPLFFSWFSEVLEPVTCLGIFSDGVR